MARKRKKDPAVVGKEVASRPGPVAVVWTLDRVKSRCEVADEFEGRLKLWLDRQSLRFVDSQESEVTTW